MVDRENELVLGYRQNVEDIVQGALFPEAGLDGGIGHAGGVGGLVVVRDISLFSYCESCLLPFKVECHIGYVPSGQRVVGLSKLSRAADVFARRLQEPQRLANEVCSALENGIKPAGVAVTLQCWHIQLPAAEKRSNHALCNSTKLEMHGWVLASVSSGSGVFENKNSAVWDEFSTLLKLRGVSMEKNNTSVSSSPYWCPSRTLDKRNPLNCKISSKPGAIQLPMVSAVASIICSLGEDLLRKELVGTPYRFLEWFMNFKRYKSETKLLNGLDLGKMSPLNLNVHIKARGNLVDRDRYGILRELNLPFWSQCEHHLLPFHGVVHVGYFYVEEGEAVERSVLQSIVQFYSSNLQVQERLTRQIAETVSSVFSTSVMVVVEASHICMISRGIEKVGSSTATIAVVGQFSTDPVAKAMFLQSVSNSGTP